MASLIAPFQRCSLRARHTSTATVLAPFLQQSRSASILSSLSNLPGSYSKCIRRGRGPSSGKGKTSGRGHKGQKQHGKVPRGFNGGQTPDEVVHGKRGFENQFSLEMTTVNLDKIQSWIDQGRIDPSKPITIKELQESRCTHQIKDGVKLLARNAGDLRTPIHIVVSRASASAIAAIEGAGGTVQTRYYTRPSIRRILRGETHPTLSLLSPKPELSSEGEADFSIPADIPIAPAALCLGLKPISSYKYRLPDPAGRKDLEYYRDPAHRGYLSYMVGGNEGPSLFFKTPQQIEALAAANRRKGKAAEGAQARASENRLW